MQICNAPRRFVMPVAVAKPIRSSSPSHGTLDMSVRCPNCKSQGMEIVYGIDNIPVHSTIQLADRAKALAFPTGNLKLGYCPACAFLGNTLYDPHVQAYSTQCEESQHVSATFNKFAHTLA